MENSLDRTVHRTVAIIGVNSSHPGQFDSLFFLRGWQATRVQLFNKICIMHSDNAEAFGSQNRIDCIIYTIDSHGSWGKSGTQLGAHKGYLTNLVTLFFDPLSLHFNIFAFVFV